MNLDPSETKLENLLRGLVPDAPSSVLMERIDEELKLDMSWLNATARPKRRAVTWITSAGWSAFGAAAAVAVMTFMPAQTPGTYQNTATLASATPVSAPAAAVLPVSTSTISEWDDAPQADSHDNAQRRLEQAQYVRVSTRADNKQAWLTHRDRARITLEYADAEKLALPVNFLSEAPFPLRDLPYNP